MAKKKINIKSVPTDVESGDVNISYKNVRIAGLSETTTAVLETKDTICEDDIEVEYTKPGGVSFPAFSIETIDNPSVSYTETGMNGDLLMPDNSTNALYSVNMAENASDAPHATHYIPSTTRDGYKFQMRLITDFVTRVEVNGVALTADDYYTTYYLVAITADTPDLFPDVAITIQAGVA